MAGSGGRKSFRRDKRLRDARRAGQKLPSRTIQPSVSSSTSFASTSSTTQPSRMQTPLMSKAGASAEDSILLSSGGSSDSSFSPVVESRQSSTCVLKTPESDSDDSVDELLDSFDTEKKERSLAKIDYIEKLRVFNQSLNEFPQLQVLMKNRLNKNSSDKDSASFGKEMIMSCVSGIISHRDEFLLKARDVDKISQGDLVDRVNRLLPVSISVKKISKVTAASLLVDFWFLYRELELSSPRYSRDSKTENRDFVGMLQRIEHVTKDEIDESNVIEKALKSIAISKQERERLYKQGGGFLSKNKKLHNCPKCLHGYVDEPPSNKNALKKNAEETTVWTRQCQMLEDFEKGVSNEFPKDKNGRQLYKIVAPKLVPLLGHCHCVQLHASYTNPAHKCPVNCEDKKTKIQYPQGQCPICKCNCSFVYDLKKHNTILAAIEYEKKQQKSITPTNRAAAKDYLVQAAKAGTIVREEALHSLAQQRDNGLLNAKEDDINRQSTLLGQQAHATFIVNNPPSLQASQHLRRQMRVAQHPDGPVFANLGGDPSKATNMRSYSKSTAAQQRARNTGLHPMVDNSSFASADSTLSTSSSMIGPPTIVTQQQHHRQQTPQRANKKNGRKRVKKHIYSALSSTEQPPTPLTTEAMAVVLETMAEEKTSAVVARIDDAEEDGMEIGTSQDIMAQCVVMQKALLKRDRDFS